MIKTLFARMQQGYRTNAFPKTVPPLPDRFRGLPRIDRARCPATCTVCADVCPTRAIAAAAPPAIDLGACIFCTECSRSCPFAAITFSRDHRLSARTRDGIVLSGETLATCESLGGRLQSLFGRSFKFRQVSAGGCNACEADINVLSTAAWDMGRFGIQNVASPRHADGLLVTGPVTKNMRTALCKTYEAIPEPKLVIAVGACAVSGGLFRSGPAQHRGVDSVLPVDLYIAGCPPHPLTILDGLLRLLGGI